MSCPGSSSLIVPIFRLRYAAIIVFASFLDHFRRVVYPELSLNNIIFTFEKKFKQALKTKKGIKMQIYCLTLLNMFARLPI